MIKNAVTKKCSLSISANSAVAMAVGVILSSCGFSAAAQQRTGARDSVQAAAPADLERAFWSCDYAGTTGSVGTGMAIACTAITDELKVRKFNGDFDAMVAWWRENKPAEHQALAARRRATASVGTAPQSKKRENGI